MVRTTAFRADAVLAQRHVTYFMSSEEREAYWAEHRHWYGTPEADRRRQLRAKSDWAIASKDDGFAAEIDDPRDYENEYYLNLLAQAKRPFTGVYTCDLNQLEPDDVREAREELERQAKEDRRRREAAAMFGNPANWLKIPPKDRITGRQASEPQVVTFRRGQKPVRTGGRERLYGIQAIPA